MLIANATAAQVANATDAGARLWNVLKAPEQDFRRARLADLLDHPDFGGRKVALGRALGYDSGAFVSQMLRGDRPISEKTVQQVESMSNGKFRGWFTVAPTRLSPHALRVAQLFDDLPPGKRRIAYAMVQSLHNPDGEDISLDALDPTPALPTPQQDKAQ